MATLEELCINTIRFLAVDMVQQAKSGHPGAPMGMAPMAYVLWDRFLQHNPGDSKWPDRDRFILSAGHASAMLYALLHLTGYDLPLDEIKRFRQWGSKTPGHPEYGTVPGVETTTGPLGQGFANGVGMAIAEKWLAEHYNRPGYEIIDHNTYAIVSDGDLQEGVASEAASLAGTLRLGKLIYLYDDNGISIEGNTDITFVENVAQRFQAYGWHVIGPIDGMDTAGVDAAIRAAQTEKERPSLIICRTIIGYGSPHKAGTASSHGEPLGEEEVNLAKEHLGWPYREPFTVPSEVLAHFRQAGERGVRRQQEWETSLEAYRQAYPGEARQLEEDLSGDLREGWDGDLDDLFKTTEKPLATRQASGKIMNAIAKKVHAFTGGSADLAPSTKTILEGQGHYGFEEYCGHNLHFGVREHAMGAIASGMSLHGGIIPYTATFLVFYDYMRPPVRLAALMGTRVIYIFTHDSIGVGEDGPTHQPIEQLMGLREVPNLVTIRPADAGETVAAWKVAMERRQGPTALILSRQNLPVLDRNVLAPASGARQGAYILWEAASPPEVIIIGSGSEVHIALEAGKLLQEKGIKARVVSMPSWELFDAQPADYRHEVLPPNIRARISIEAGTPLGWERYVGLDGVAIGIPCFGASAPGSVIYKKLGLTARRIADAAFKLLHKDESFEKPMASIGTLTGDVEATLADLVRRDIVKRIWRKDYRVWKPEPAEITNRLGWLNATDLMSEQVPALRSFAREVVDAGFRHVVLLGMGGSSLGTEVLRQIFGKAKGYPELLVLDSTIPARIQAVRESIDPAHTLFLVSSKSGTTTEPLALWRYFKGLVAASTGEEKAGDNFIAVTDRGTPLVKLAEDEGFRRVFLNPPDIGGRYSVLSYFGLVPAALTGIDVMTLLERCDGMREACASCVPADENPGAWLGAFLGAMAQQGRDKLTLLTSPSVGSFGLWVEQLIAESTGKEGKGIIPVAMEPLLAPGYYGDDRIFVYLRLRGGENSAIDAEAEQIRLSGQPMVTLEMKDKYDLAAEFFRWEFATAIAGAILGIHPFDQPDVQRAKDATERVLREYTAKGHLPAVAASDTLDDLLAGVESGNYLAIMAYIHQTAEVDRSLAALRRKLTERYHITTTLGYGPRFLHSTGQLHKGGPDTGLFLQITTKHERDLPIPGEPYTFGIVADAQALGDLAALQSLGRRVVRVHSEHGGAAAISELIDKLV